MSTFRADCSRCCGLCCVVPGQMAVQGFRVDKPAETPCEASQWLSPVLDSRDPPVTWIRRLRRL